MISGFLVVDKPAGITSHDVVSVLRAMLGIKKIGHTGTLDPFATGVLPMAVGPSTRLIQFLDESEKVYDARVQFGVSTDTGDLTGEVSATLPVPELSIERLVDVAASFEGQRMQTPPAYSAVKVDGKALYKYAREGQKVKAKARPISVYSMAVVGHGDDWVDLRVVCSRGTYVRVLAEEFGQALGTCAHLVALRRTASGPFSLEAGVSFEALSLMASDSDDWRRVLRPRRGEERVQWRSREDIQSMLLPRFTVPDVALSHLPRQILSEEDLMMLRLRGRTGSGPDGLGEGDHWLAYEGERFLGVMVSREVGHRVARMLAQG